MQEPFFPGKHWETHDRSGWSEPTLEAVRSFAATGQTLSMMIVQHGRIVDMWGDVTQKIEVRSVRKSFLSALFGVHEKSINLGMTLEELDIDDRDPKLTPDEKQATILDLLRSRSGVYHAAARETAAMRAGRPARGLFCLNRQLDALLSLSFVFPFLAVMNQPFSFHVFVLQAASRLARTFTTTIGISTFWELYSRR